MTIIIRRDRPPRRGLPVAVVLIGVASIGLGALLVLAWSRGGPQPLHAIAVQVAATPTASATLTASAAPL